MDYPLKDPLESISDVGLLKPLLMLLVGGLPQLTSVCRPFAGAHALRACVEVVVEAIALHECLVRLWQSGGGALVSAVGHSLFPRETGNSLQNMDKVQVAL